MLDKFYRKRYKILGGPGCGKTTKILEILSNYLKGGVNPRSSFNDWVCKSNR